MDKFDQAIDEFFSKLEAQKIELKTVQFEKQALKKLENVKKDHVQRIEKLRHEQAHDRRRAELIEMNETLVNNALTVMRSALANQIDWKEINELIEEATANQDPVASRIKQLKLDTNHFSMLLSDPYSHLDEEDSEEDEDENSGAERESSKIPSEMIVDIDIDHSAQVYPNAHAHAVQ